MIPPFDHFEMETGPKNQFGSPIWQTTKIGLCARAPESPWIEARWTVRKLYEHYQQLGPFQLFMSGGIDSEAMALSFLAESIPVRAMIGRYNGVGRGGLNEPDYKHAVSFCQEHNIPFDYFDVDLDDFFLNQKKHLEYAKLDDCRSPQLAIHLHIFENTKGFPLVASNPTDIIEAPHLNSPFLGFPGEPHGSYGRHFHRLKRPAIPYFFHATPELTYSFFATPQFRKEITEALRQLRPYVWDNFLKRKPQAFSSYEGKVLKYQQGGFNVQARDYKRTGFEEVKGYFQEKFPDTPGPFDSIFRKEMEQICPYPLSYNRLLSMKNLPNAELFRQFMSLI